MQPNQYDIHVLKPTQAFLSFLQSQLDMFDEYAYVDLPDLNMLQTDCTAYILSKQFNDEETLDEIERHFSTMFKYEISRWLGENAYNEIETSFLDFLCCFKFEMHSQVMLLEPSLDAGKHMIRVKPRSVLLKSMKTCIEKENDIGDVLDKIQITHLAENATVIVKNFPNLSEIKVFLEKNYPLIFEAEMSRLCQKPEQWPEMASYETFNKYFAVDIHSHLVNLVH